MRSADPANCGVADPCRYDLVIPLGQFDGKVEHRKRPDTNKGWQIPQPDWQKCDFNDPNGSPHENIRDQGEPLPYVWLSVRYLQGAWRSFIFRHQPCRLRFGFAIHVDRMCVPRPRTCVQSADASASATRILGWLSIEFMQEAHWRTLGCIRVRFYNLKNIYLCPCI